MSFSVTAGQVPGAVADWVEDMCSSWDFRRIIPCHFSAPIAATPADLRCRLTLSYAGRVDRRLQHDFLNSSSRMSSHLQAALRGWGTRADSRIQASSATSCFL